MPNTYQLSKTWSAEEWADFKRRIPDVKVNGMRRAHRVDGNQAELVSYLRALGCSVAVTSVVGGGFPDLVVAYCEAVALAEVKDPKQPRHDREKNKSQEAFRAKWHSHVWTITTHKECDTLFAHLKARRDK